MYHVERTCNTASWRSIRMKTPVNVNGVRDRDDGFGEASNIYSHSGLAENEEFDESCQDFDDATPITVTVDIQEKPGTSFTQAKDDNELNHLSVDDSHIENEKDCKMIENITVKVEAQGLSPKSSDCVKVEEDTDWFAKGLHTKQEPEQTLFEKQGTGKIDNGNITKFMKIQSTSGIRNRNVVEKDTEVGISDEGACKTSKGVDGHSVLYPSVTQILKCDYCDFRSIDMSSIREHLQCAVHYSASKYDIDDSGEVILVDELLAKNEDARFKTTVIRCPVNTCSAIFLQMKECVNHYNDLHWALENPQSQFALVDIVNENECSIKIKPITCNLCPLSLRNKGSLIKHLQEKHIPKKSLSKCKNTFLCGYCEKSFPWLDIVVSHFRKHKPLMNTLFKFSVFQFDNVRKFRMLNSGRIERLNDIKNITSNLGKRTLAISSNEPNIKISRKMDSESREVTMEDKTDHEQVAMGDEEVVRCEQISTSSESHDTTSTTISVTEGKHQDKDLHVPMHTETDSKKDTLKDAFSCDFCRELTYLEEQMVSHLIEKCHTSASHVFVDGDKNICYVKLLSRISGVASRRQKAYVVCPENCKFLFSNVKLYIEHYIYYHNSIKEFKPCYGVVEVRDEVVLKLSVDMCVVCGEKCKKTKHLSLHYRNKHYPFPMKDGCDLFFKCSPCQRTFNSFPSSLTHAKKHLDLTKENQFEISVLYLERRIRKCELPTKFSNNTNQLKEEVKNLQTTIHEIDSTSKALLERKVRHKMKKTAKKAKARLLRILTY